MRTVIELGNDDLHEDRPEPTADDLLECCKHGAIQVDVSVVQPRRVLVVEARQCPIRSNPSTIHRGVRRGVERLARSHQTQPRQTCCDGRT